MDDLKWWLKLQAVPGVGPTLFKELVGRFGTPEKALGAPIEALLDIPKMDRETARAIASPAENPQVEAQFQAVKASRVGVLTLNDPRYPPLLREIHAPPPILYFLGKWETIQRPGVAIVGSRHASSYGSQTAAALSRDLTQRGFAVVSGMARGIDAAAHRAALERGGATVAVLGTGVDIAYPAEHRSLYEDISKAGVVLSEFPMGTGPEPHHFPRRNRVISGMSLGVVVVEATLSSGALVTARHALEQGREVFAVPGPVSSERSLGPNRLIQDGAKLVLTAEDIVTEFRQDLRGFEPAPKSLPARSSGEEQAVLEALSETPLHVDGVTAAAGLSPGKTLAALLALEMEGLARQLPGKRFVRA